MGKSRGTTSGATTIVQSGDTIGLVTFQGADGTNLVETTRVWSQIDGTPGANDMPGRLIFSTTADGNQTPTERMRITNAGSLGIGETSPDTFIHAKSSTARLTLESTAADESSIAHITPEGGTYVGQVGANGEIVSSSTAGDYVISNRTGNDIILSADSSFVDAHLTIKETANVGISTGSTVPSRLAVRLSGNNDGNVSNWTSDMATFHIGGNNSTSQALAISGSTSANSMFITALTPSVTWTDLTFRANNYKFIHQGASTSSPFLQMNNNGISFDQGSNYLDDYEEGTWSPTIVAKSTNFTSVTYGTQTGTYIKVGRKITLTGRLDVNATSGGSGALCIGGFPYSSAGAMGGTLGYFSGLDYNDTVYNQVSLYMTTSGGDKAIFTLSGDNVGAIELPSSGITSTFDCTFTITYITS